MKLSIALPTSDMPDKDYFFKRCLDSLWMQEFQDFEIVVTDNSSDNVIKEICEFYLTGINYSWNPRKGMAQNTNEAIKQSKGELIKILYMDDFLNHEKALQNIVDKFKGEWLVTACTHSITGEDRFNTHFPKYNDEIHLNNTIGSPSVLTVRNNEPLLFDEELTWLLDADLYKRYYQKYGAPVILDDIGVCIGLHDGQATHTMGEARKLREYEYVRQKVYE